MSRRSDSDSDAHRDARATPAPDARVDADATSAAADTLVADLAAVTGGDPLRELRFWRARAIELAAQVERLQQRCRALASHLPAADAALLHADPATLARDPGMHDPLAGWRETTDLEPAHVASELTRLWASLGRAR